MIYCFQKPPPLIYLFVSKSPPPSSLLFPKAWAFINNLLSEAPSLIYVLFPETHHHPVYCLQKPGEILLQKAHIDLEKAALMFTKVGHKFTKVGSMFTKAASVVYKSSLMSLQK